MMIVAWVRIQGLHSFAIVQIILVGRRLQIIVQQILRTVQAPALGDAKVETRISYALTASVLKPSGGYKFSK